MNPAKAREIIATLERDIGGLNTEPVAVQDQWTAKLRDQLVDLDVDPDDPGQRRAVFAGAFMLTCMLLPHGVIERQFVITAVAALRALADRADAEVPALPPITVDDPQPARRWWHL